MLSLKKDTVLVFRRANGGGRRDFFEDNNRLGPTLALSNRKSSQQQDAAGRLSLETDEDGEESIKRCWTFNHPLLHNRNTSISLPVVRSKRQSHSPKQQPTFSLHRSHLSFPQRLSVQAHQRAAAAAVAPLHPLPHVKLRMCHLPGYIHSTHLV